MSQHLSALGATAKLIEVLPTFYACIASQRLDEFAKRFSEGDIVTTGVGKAGAVARKVASTLATFGCPAHYIHPTEALHGELGNLDFAIWAFSASGDTPEMITMMQHVWLDGVTLFTANRVAKIPHRDLVLVPQVQEDVPVVGAILLQLAGDGLALEVARERGFTAEALARYHPANR